MFIKICGITRLEDAELAAELGASAIGFIFWPGSPRYMEPEYVRDIVRVTSSKVASVGVFVNESPRRVREIVDAAALDMVQFHGNESADYCRKVLNVPPPNRDGRLGPASPKRGLRKKVIKAVGLKDNELPDLSAFDENTLILLDAHDPARHGGTGRTVSWEMAREIAASRPTILSGGLSAENVAAAIRTVRPYGVDVSSGVESAPGVKDRTRMKQFFEALHD